MVGTYDGQQISLKTEEISGGEFVQSYQLLPYFRGRFQYDAFSGTVVFTRKDGKKIGLKVEEERVIADVRIFHTGTPVLRKNGRILIPLNIVDSYLFPGVLREGKASAPVVPVAAPSESVPPTPKENVFTYSVSTPVVTPPAIPLSEPTPVASPTYPTYIFNSHPVSTLAPVPTPVAASPVYSAVVVLDPGNDKSNPGPSNSAGIREYELTMSVCEKIAQSLKENKGYKVVYTRTLKEQEPVSVEQRISAANKNNADVFISIHCGGMFSNAVSRSAVFFMNPELDTVPPYVEWIASGSNPWITLWHEAYKYHVDGSVQIAKKVNERLQVYYQKSGIIKIDPNPRPGRLSILRGLTMPGIVIELGNITHPDTARFLSRDRILQDIAGEISIEISNFLLERTGMASLRGKP